VKYLNKQSVFFFLCVFWLYSATASSGILRKFDWNFTSLIHFGHHYIDQNEDITPPGSVRLLGNEASGGNGYDGQIFYYYARTLLIKDRWPHGFSNAYRAPRVGYPLLVSPFSLLGNGATALGMIFVQLLAISGGIVCFYLLLPPNRRYLTLIYCMSPFLLQSFLFLVSDSVMISLLIVGWYFFSRGGKTNVVAATVLFSIAILTKESSLFLLFPLGLYGILRRDLRLCITLISALIPMFLWQFYLFRVHGMVPASILSIFLSPLSGVLGVLRQTLDQLKTHPVQFGDLAKQSAKWILIAILPASVWATLSGLRVPKSLREFFALATPENAFRGGALLVITTILIADFQYFWGIFENVGRMFTALVPAVILARAPDERLDKSFKVFIILILVLSFIVWLRFVFLTQSFPYDIYHPYNGPRYALPPIPGR